MILLHVGLVPTPETPFIEYMHTEAHFNRDRQSNIISCLLFATDSFLANIFGGYYWRKNIEAQVHQKLENESAGIDW